MIEYIALDWTQSEWASSPPDLCTIALPFPAEIQPSGIANIYKVTDGHHVIGRIIEAWPHVRAAVFALDSPFHVLHK